MKVGRNMKKDEKHWEESWGKKKKKKEETAEKKRKDVCKVRKNSEERFLNKI